MLDEKKREVILKYIIKRAIRIGDILKKYNEYVILLGIKEYTERKRTFVILRCGTKIPTEEMIFSELAYERYEEIALEDIKLYQKTRLTYDYLFNEQTNFDIKDFRTNYDYTINETILLEQVHIGTILNILGFEYGLVINIDPLEWVVLETDRVLNYEGISNKLMNESIEVNRLKNTFLLGTKDIRYVTEIKDKRLRVLLNKLNLLGKLEVKRAV